MRKILLTSIVIINAAMVINTIDGNIFRAMYDCLLIIMMQLWLIIDKDNNK